MKLTVSALDPDGEYSRAPFPMEVLGLGDEVVRMHFDNGATLDVRLTDSGVEIRAGDSRIRITTISTNIVRVEPVHFTAVEP